MEQPNTDRSLLFNLALVYLALAHGTDAQLDDAELDTIADRLRVWQAAADGASILGAIRDALDAYTRGGAEVDAAARAIAEAASPELRQQMLDDLMEIALADGRFLYREGTFIGSLAQLWEVHPQQRPGGEAWSLLGGEPGAWTPAHDLAFVYLTLAHKTDCELSRTEIEAVIRKVGEWLPEAQEDEVRMLVKEVLSAYARRNGVRAFAEAVESVKRAVPGHQRAALLADLHYVANADGVMLVEEKKLIARLAKAWGVPLDA